jgi:hypothetical protein
MVARIPFGKHHVWMGENQWKLRLSYLKHRKERSGRSLKPLIMALGLEDKFGIKLRHSPSCAEVLELWGLLKQVQLVENIDDGIVWGLAPSG